MKHTPGPWHVEAEVATEGRREVVCARPEGKDGFVLAVVFPEHYPEDERGEWDGHFTEEDRANARLIAAAPELLQALKSAESIFNGQHNLLSTATEAERLKVLENLIGWWNQTALPAIQKADPNF